MSKKKRPGDRRGEHPNSLANLASFLPGNQAARQHGGYAQHFPSDVVQTVDDADSGNNVARLEGLIRLEQMRLHSVLSAKAKWDAGAEYNELSSADLELTGTDTDAQGTTIRRRRPDFEQAIDRAVGRLLALIAEQERIAATPAHVAARLSEVLDDASAAGLDAATTAEQVERAGLAVPFSLQQRVRAELALIEAPEPEGGVTDDELERLSAEYDAQAAREPDWLAERRRQVKEIHHQRDKERSGQ